jgi:hypothetical protein
MSDHTSASTATRELTTRVAGAAPRPGLPLVPAVNTLRLAAQHFGAALLYLVAGAAGLVWIAPELSAGMYTAPRVAGVTHLFTLGWITTTIFGALHQVLPGALGAPIRSERAAHLGFWTFAPGAGLFAAGVATGVTALHHGGIALVSIGILLTVGNIAFALPRARARDVTWWAIAIASAFLVSTLVLGVMLLHNLHTGFIADARLRFLATHLHVALAGWALIMMVGISHRMLPMFLVAHGADTRWSARSVALLTVGVPTLGTGLLGRIAALSWVGVLLLGAGVACFLFQAYAFHAVRVKKKLDVGMRYAAVALGFLGVSALLGPAVLVDAGAHPRLATIYVVVALLGGVVLYAVGFFYKIGPQLAWTALSRDPARRGAIPSVAALFSARVALAQLALMSFGILLLAAGIAVASPSVTRGGGALLLGGVLLFISQVARVALVVAPLPSTST